MPAKKKAPAKKVEPVAPDKVEDVAPDNSEALSVKEKTLEERVEYLEGFIIQFSNMVLHAIKNTGNDAVVRSHGFKTYDYTSDDLKGKRHD